jgi:hypothetical protein
MEEDRELLSKDDLLAFRTELQAMEERLSTKIELFRKELSGEINNVKTELDGKIVKVRIELDGKIEDAILRLERKLDHRFKITVLLIIFSDLIIFLNAHKEAIGHLFKTFLNLIFPFMR